MSKYLKIALYSGEIPSTTFIERLISGVAEKGHHVLLFGALNYRPKYCSGVYILGYRNTKLNKLFYLLGYSLLLLLFKYKKKRRLDRFLKQEKRYDLYSRVKYYPVLWHRPDVFHVQWAKGIGEWQWVQQFGIKLILSLRGAHINYSPIADFKLANKYRYYFPKIDGFHAVSKAIGMEAQQYGASASKTAVVYSGLSMNPKIDRKWQVKNRPFNIVSVGRGHWIKGYTYALDACKVLKDSGFSFKYVIVGGAYTIEYQYQIHDLGLDDYVTLLKHQTFERTQDLIQEADLLVLPSVEEGIANVVLEAMASRTLVLSTSCGGIPEVITDEINGFLVPIRDTQAMAEKIQRIEKLTKTEKQSILKEAQHTILEQHSDKRMIAGMETLYQSVLNSELK